MIKDESREVLSTFPNSLSFFKGVLSGMSNTNDGKPVALFRNVYSNDTFICEHIWLILRKSSVSTLKTIKYGSEVSFYGRPEEYCPGKWGITPCKFKPTGRVIKDESK